MANDDFDTCRLCLVTPSGGSPEGLGTMVDAALSAGDVASLIVTADAADLARLAQVTVPIAQAHGVAALIHNDRQIAAATGADGVHFDGRVTELRACIDDLHPDRIVGAGNLTSRHDAMAAGEAEPDYVFFGRLDGDTGEEIFPKALGLAEWWAGLFQIPAVVMGGSDLNSVQQARDAGIEFVALRRAVWEHPDGPADAVALANRLLAEARDAVP